MPQRKLKRRTAAEIAKEYVDLKAQAAKLYGDADAALEQLAKVTRGKPFQFSSTHVAMVKNNWRGQSKAFAPAFSRKFELEVKAGTLPVSDS